MRYGAWNAKNRELYEATVNRTNNTCTLNPYRTKYLMSRTKHEMPKHKNVRKRANPLGICNCIHCRYGRMGKKDSTIMRLKAKMRRWWSNKGEKRGAYTD